MPSYWIFFLCLFVTFSPLCRLISIRCLPCLHNCSSTISDWCCIIWPFTLIIFAIPQIFLHFCLWSHHLQVCHGSFVHVYTYCMILLCVINLGDFYFLLNSSILNLVIFDQASSAVKQEAQTFDPLLESMVNFSCNFPTIIDYCDKIMPSLSLNSSFNVFCLNARGDRKSVV